ncbi:hypothetical protein QYE76_014117 [Lolium multiflorum]|uniref:Pentatricopeptide repeat-containing protein n=1 Tax=Lolium multiflorum TaxID=4521 RepID=A0AAD8U058_LOLMU|nr:hypothetical protein QYE76_014117 [Lolium multiflorum]
MTRLNSAAPALLLRRSSSTSTSPPSSRAPHVALAAATERVRSGTLSPEDAHHLFDELLRQASPVPERALNGFLAAVARAPASRACSDGLSLAVALFDRMPLVAPPTVWTYSILLDCCCRAGQPDLALAFFGRFLRTGLKADIVIVGTLLKVLCHAKRTDEAADVLLHRMTDLGCVPDVISYTTVIKGFCDDSRSHRALDLLLMMAKQEGGCSPDVVSYTTVIHGFLKEGKFRTASNLFNEMVQQGVVPNVFTYSSMIDVLCKRGRSKEARQILDCAVAKGLKPNVVAYSTMLHGYATEGCLVDMNNLYNLMVGEGEKPDVITFSSLIDGYCLVGKMQKASRVCDDMVSVGIEPNAITYSTLIDGYFKAGMVDAALTLFREMSAPKPLRKGLGSAALLLPWIIRKHRNDCVFERGPTLCYRSVERDQGGGFAVGKSGSYRP